MTETKHSPLPWAVRPRGREFDDWGVIRDADLKRAARAEWSMEADLDSHRVAGTDPSQANADFIVLACNAYYSDQATIAEQAARIAWLERAVTDEEISRAIKTIRRHSATERDEAIIGTTLTAALAIRTKPENREKQP